MKKKKLKAQANTYTGVVGFFDILGYQNLLEKNEPEDVALKVLPILTGLNTIVSTCLVKESRAMLPKTGTKLFKHVINLIQWLIFSDTILLAMPIENDATAIDRWLAFLSVCISLQTNMFHLGLPLRGVINFGKYFLKDTCFAGKSIIEAHKLCYQLELSACVLTEKAIREINKQLVTEHDKKIIINTFFFNYLIPTKEGEIHLDTLAAHYLVSPKKDIHSAVMECFWGHNKDIPISASAKMSNTAQWLTFLKMKEKENT